MLSPEMVARLAAIYREEFGVELREEEAVDAASRLYRAFRIVHDGGYGNGANNQATVAGPNSVWSSSGDLNIGYFGSFNTLLVTNGGRVANSFGYIGGDNNSLHLQIANCIEYRIRFHDITLCPLVPRL